MLSYLAGFVAYTASILWIVTAYRLAAYGWYQMAKAKEYNS